MRDEAKSADIIHPRADGEPPEVLRAREWETFRRLVLAEAAKAAQLAADQQRYRHLKRDRRALLAQLDNIEREVKEIEGRHARHLLKLE